LGFVTGFEVIIGEIRSWVLAVEVRLWAYTAIGRPPPCSLIYLSTCRQRHYELAGGDDGQESQHQGDHGRSQEMGGCTGLNRRQQGRGAGGGRGGELPVALRDLQRAGHAGGRLVQAGEAQAAGDES